MIFKKKIICIIPAKKKSVGLKKKNFRLINGNSLFIHSINAARRSKFIDRIVISSDSDKILDTAKKLKIEAFKRPSKLSTSKAQVIEVIFHVLRKIKEKFDLIVLLQPTTPIILFREIDNAIKLLIQKNLNSVISIKNTNLSLLHLFNLNKKNFIRRLIKKKNISSNRQDYNSYYTPSGDFFISKIDKLIKVKSFYGKKCFGYITKNKFSVDINFKKDLEYLEFLLKKKYR